MDSQRKTCFITASIEKFLVQFSKPIFPHNTGRLHMRSFYVNFQCLEKKASFWICETWFNIKTVITSLTVGCDNVSKEMFV